jgi:hypothetical protein
MSLVEVINIIMLIGRDESESSSPEPSLAFGAVWAVVSFVVPARFRVGFFLRVLEDLSSNNYINIVYEEFQHLFYFNFGVLVRGIRVIFNKVMFLVTDH